MANTLGLPEINITFSSQATTAINRSSRGVVAMILNDENVTDEDGVIYKLIEDASDVPTKGISNDNIDLIEKALMGIPYRVHLYLIPKVTYTVEQEVTVEKQVDSDVVITRTVDSDVTVTDTETGETDTRTIQVTVTDTEVQQVTITDTEVQTSTITSQITQSDALKKCVNVRFNYICHPTGDSKAQQSLASWVISQRKTRNQVFKAVVAHYDADNYGVINFTTDKIKLENPAYIAALEGLDADEEISSDIPQYLTYSARSYTARIAGILAGLSLDRSATYYSLTEIVDIAEYDDIDEHINAGELCLVDEKDGSGVKIARGCNSLHSFTNSIVEDFRFIKVVEGLDLIKQDIRDAFRNDYIGKVPNTYDNKQLFVSAIMSYLNGLKGNVLDPSATTSNYVEIDAEKNLSYAKSHGADVDSMTDQAILEYNTGTHVFLRGRLTPVNCMEDLDITFYLD